MREVGRIKKILVELEKYWNKNQDLRLCQIIKNLNNKQYSCIYCEGSGLSGPGRQHLCLRCLGEGKVWMDNYNTEDEVILSELEKLNEVQEC